MAITSLDLFEAYQKYSPDDAVKAQSCLDAAERAVENRIGARLGTGPNQQPPEPDLTSAILLWAGHLFENTEGVVVGTISSKLDFSIDALLAPYRRWGAEPDT